MEKIKKSSQIGCAKYITFNILICTFLETYGNFIASDNQQINGTYVLEQYIAFCGHEHLCFKNDTLMKTSFSEMSTCPTCSCNVSCLSQFTCCIDLYLSFPTLSCRKVDIEEFRSADSEVYLLVDECPQGTNGELDANCREKNASLVDRFLHPPVTSSGKYKITFKNKYCAICNGYHNFSTWIVNMSCPVVTDFNYFSSYEEIFQKARENFCSVSFYPKNENFSISCKKKKKRKGISGWDIGWYQPDPIDTCNETKSLKTLDKDVSQLCESEYKLEYILPMQSSLSFKNVFCFMCNPPYYSYDFLSACNETGVWDKHDGAVEKACLEYPRNVATYPFKNVFCRICNMDGQDKTMFQDVKVDILTKKGGYFDMPFSYDVKVKSTNPDYLIRKYELDETNTYINVSVSGKIYSDFEAKHKVNLTNLFIQRYAYGPVPYCKYSDLMYVPTDGCSTCNMLDIECIARCCYDFAFVYPVSCYPVTLLTDASPHKIILHHLMVDGCFRNSSSKIRELCSKKHVTDTIFTTFPVTLKYFEMTYRNAFCALCNYGEEKPFHEKIKGITFYNIRLRCPLYIMFNNHVFLQTILRVAQEMKCIVDFIHPTESGSTCQESKTTGRCNITGQLEKLDPDVDWACENIETYRTRDFKEFSFHSTTENEFCTICNPTVKWDVGVINSCNESGYWIEYDEEIERACTNLPQLPVLYPYKNRFCQICNEPSVQMDISYNPNKGFSNDDRDELVLDSDSMIIGDGADKNLPSFTLRNIFSLAEYERDESKRTRQKCQHNQVQDFSQGRCRNISCYPGKILRNSTCISLLSMTNNLRYVVTMKATVKTNYSEIVEDIMEAYHMELFFSALNIVSFFLEELHLISNKPCDNQFKNNSLEIFVYLRLFVKETVPRLETEENLLSFMNRTIQLQGRFQGTSIEQQYSGIGLHVPVLMHESNFDEQCYRQYTYSDENKLYRKFRAVHVAPLLLCTQTHFEKYEYRLSYDKMNLMLIHYNKKLSVDEFQIVKDGKAAVCIDNIKSYLQSSPSSFKTIDALAILSLVCIIVSVVCLLVTLLTYFLLRQLRTLPGKNNMCLICSLLVAQVLLIIQPRITDIDTLCMLVGSLSHFAWLSYFAWLGIGTFHMFRVFAGGLSRHGSDVNKILRRYSLFAFGLPGLIVATVVIVSLVQSKGKDAGYSTYRCFIEERIAFILTLLTPLIMMCTINIVLFVLTAFKISNTPKVQKNKEDTVHFLVYVKLFILTGISWTVQIVDSFLLISFLSYVSVIFNGTQGLYLLLGYVCNERVLRFYRNLFCTPSELNTKSSTRSNFTSSSVIPNVLDSKL